MSVYVCACTVHTMPDSWKSENILRIKGYILDLMTYTTTLNLIQKEKRWTKLFLKNHTYVHTENYCTHTHTWTLTENKITISLTTTSGNAITSILQMKQTNINPYIF